MYFQKELYDTYRCIIEGRDVIRNTSILPKLTHLNHSPILPLCFDPPNMTTVHTIAQTGFGTGTNELYDR